MPEALPAEGLLTQLLLLQARAHRAIEDDDPLLQQTRQLVTPTLGWGNLTDSSRLSH